MKNKLKRLISVPVDYTKIRNEFHFNIQRKTRAAKFEDRTKYNRNRYKDLLRKGVD